jgi:hypothetical protein
MAVTCFNPIIGYTVLPVPQSERCKYGITKYSFKSLEYPG